MPTTYIVATDGSEESMNAARWTTLLADRSGADVEILDVLHQPFAEMNPEEAERFEHDAAAALAERLGSVGISVARPRAKIGDVERVLLDASTTAGLLVLGSAERAGWGRHGHFSLVHSLAHHVACPIVVTPSGPWTQRQPVVVVGIDGTDASRRTLAWAVAFAERAAMRVVAAFVIDALYATFSSGGWYGTEEHRASAEGRDESVEVVERFGADPAVALEAVASDYDAALLVVGAKGRHSLGGTLLGAIPDELLHHPTCPIAVVPHSMITGDVETASAVGAATPSS